MIEQLLAAGEVQGAAAAVPQRRHEAARTSARRPARSSQKSFPARGLAVGDYNNDGRIDVLIGNNGGAPVLLKNNAGDGNHWLGLKLQGTACNRDAIGATHHLVGRRRRRAAATRRTAAATSRRTTRARCSASAPPTKIDWVEIKWPQPSGRVERFTDLPDRSLRHDRRRQGRVKGLTPDAAPVRAGARTFAGLFLVTLSTLTYQLLLTRTFSVTMYYHFAFVAISVTMFGMAVGAHRRLSAAAGIRAGTGDASPGDRLGVVSR